MFSAALNIYNNPCGIFLYIIMYDVKCICCYKWPYLKLHNYDIDNIISNVIKDNVYRTVKTYDNILSPEHGIFDKQRSMLKSKLYDVLEH